MLRGTYKDGVLTEPDTTEAPSRWDRRREQTHRRLLSAAERLFRGQGFDATTVEEIADAADVAKGTFFNYFSSKELLLGELLYHRIEPLLSALPVGGATAVDRIWSLLVSIRRELSPYMHLYQRMFAYAMAHPHPQSPPGDHVMLTQAVAHLVRGGQEAGLFRSDFDAEIVGALIATYFFRISVIECVSVGCETFSWEDQMQAALAIIYAGLCPAGECAF